MEGRTFNDQMQEVQRQILLYKECTNKKLKKLEVMMDLAVQKWRLLERMFKHQEDKEVKEGYSASSQRKGMFKNPIHVALSSQRAKQKTLYKWEDNNEEENVEWKEEPIYDEEPGESQDFWPEQKVILAALEGGNLDSPHTLQSEICTSERSEELGEFPNIQNMKQGKSNNNTKYGNIPSQWEDRMNTGLCPYRPEFEVHQNVYQQACLLTEEELGGMNIDAPCRKAKCVELSSFDPHILPGFVSPDPIGSSTTNCKTTPRNSPTWSTFLSGSSKTGSVGMNTHPNMDIFSLLNTFTEDTNKPPVGNNSVEKLEVNSHLTLLNEPDLKLKSEVVHGQGDKSSVSANYKGEEEQSVVEEITSMIPINMGKIAEVFPYEIIIEDPLTAATSYCFGKLSSNFGENYVLILDPGGYMHNPKGVIDEIDRVVSEINHQFVGFDYVMAVRKVLPKFMVLQQGGQGSLDKARRCEEHDAPRERVMLTIFDPGGIRKYPCVYEAQLVEETP